MSPSAIAGLIDVFIIVSEQQSLYFRLCIHQFIISFGLFMRLVDNKKFKKKRISIVPEP